MQLRYQMNDILPLLPVPQPPWGKTAYNIPCPICDAPDSQGRHLNINLKKNVFRCPKCGQFSGGGAVLFRNFLEESPLVVKAGFIQDPKASAIGYHLLASTQLDRAFPQNGGDAGVCG